MINLNRLAMYAAVAEAGSFTAAADALGTTKAVVSFNIKQLEQELGVALLTRSTRRLALTEAGEGFYGHCARLLREAEAAVDEARSGQTALSGSLRVTASVDYGNRVVAPALAAFARAHPALRVGYRAGSAHADLIAERLDLAIRVGALEDSSYRATRIGQFRLWIVGSPDLLAQHGAPRTPQALAALPWLANRPGRSDRWRLTDSKGREHELPEWLLEEPLARGTLQRLLPSYALPRLEVYAVYPDTRHVSAKVRRFIDFLRERLVPSGKP
jgi:DNA-binding transcriptional LysR family regulator